MIKLLKKSLIAVVALVSLNCHALSVVVHPSNSTSLSKEEIADIFLGKKLEFNGGVTIKAITLAEDSEVTQVFVDTVLNKTAAQLKSYWARLIFTGQGEPPLAVDSEQKMLEMISSTPNAIGFVSGKPPAGVKVVAEF